MKKKIFVTIGLLALFFAAGLGLNSSVFAADMCEHLNIASYHIDRAYDIIDNDVPLSGWRFKAKRHLEKSDYRLNIAKFDCGIDIKIDKRLARILLDAEITVLPGKRLSCRTVLQAAEFFVDKAKLNVIVRDRHDALDDIDRAIHLMEIVSHYYDCH